jgi:hypothetical protein
VVVGNQGVKVSHFKKKSKANIEALVCCLYSRQLAFDVGSIQFQIQFRISKKNNNNNKLVYELLKAIANGKQIKFELLICEVRALPQFMFLNKIN